MQMFGEFLLIILKIRKYFVSSKKLSGDSRFQEKTIRVLKQKFQEIKTVARIAKTENWSVFQSAKTPVGKLNKLFSQLYILYYLYTRVTQQQKHVCKVFIKVLKHNSNRQLVHVGEICNVLKIIGYKCYNMLNMQTETLNDELYAFIKHFTYSKYNL